VELPYEAVSRMIKRRESFMAAGLSEERAMVLADEMLGRDLAGETDRRVCFECSRLVKMKCDARWSPDTIFVLQRCPDFQLRGQK
jgi:hypothetical protein